MQKTNLSNVNAEHADRLVGSRREAIHWFGKSALAFNGPARGLLASDFNDSDEAVLESALLALKTRGVKPLVLTGENLDQQAQYLFDVAWQQTTFGRPVASKFELDLSGADVLVLKDVEAPENGRQLWYFYHHVLLPRANAGKPTLITTPLSFEEFVMYGAGSEDFEYAGRKITWEKALWLMNATMIDLHQFKQLSSEGLPPMLMHEYALFKTLINRGFTVTPQQMHGDYPLNLTIVDQGRKLDIECDLHRRFDIATVSGAKGSRDQKLGSDGWKVLRFTVAEILNNIGDCADAVTEIWQQGRKKSLVGKLIAGRASNKMPKLSDEEDEQWPAITHTNGPAATAGGAGVGKTNCILARAAFLVGEGVDPERILIIGFSSETTRYLKKGLDMVLDRQESQRVNVFTWGDLGLKILKENLTAIKRKPPVKIESNSQKVIQKLLTKFKKELDPAVLELSGELDELTVHSLISLYKANLVSPEHVKEKGENEIDALVAKVYLAYEEHLQRANRIDRDDMISLAAQLLADFPEIRSRYQHQYDYVLVDEYQDATAAGDLLARLLAFPQDNIFVVGNEDETINESRGGLPRLFADLSIRLPETRCYMLTQNRRSQPEIVEHAEKLARHLTHKKIKTHMRPTLAASETTTITGPKALPDEHAEAEWIAEEIQLLLDGGRKPGEIAVLYRYHRVALIVEEALSRKGMRCLALHPDTGLLPDEIGDIMAFLKLVMDPDGPKAREAFERICQLRSREIDPKLSAAVAGFGEQNNLSYLKAVEIYAEAVPEAPCRELAQMVKLIRTLNQENMPPAETIAFLAGSKALRLKDFYSAVKVPTGVNYEPLRAVKQLEADARKFKSISELVKNYQSNKTSDEDSEEEMAVNVLSLSEVKGREFNVVFFAGLAEGLFPAETASDLEEEKRLCYVGMTRAREQLYLSYPEKFNEVSLSPSSFLREAGFLPKEPVAGTGAAIPITRQGEEVSHSGTGIAADREIIAPPAVQTPDSGIIQQPQTVQTEELTPSVDQKNRRALGPQHLNQPLPATAAQLGADQAMKIIEDPTTGLFKLPGDHPQPGQSGLQKSSTTSGATPFVTQAAPISRQPMPGHNQLSSKNGQYCGECGAAVEPGTKFCGECGTSTVPHLLNIPACHFCGSPLEHDSKFCGECGSRQINPINSAHQIHQPNVHATALGALGHPVSTANVAQAPPTQRGWMNKLLKVLEE